MPKRSPIMPFLLGLLSVGLVGCETSEQISDPDNSNGPGVVVNVAKPFTPSIGESAPGAACFISEEVDRGNWYDYRVEPLYLHYRDYEGSSA